MIKVTSQIVRGYKANINITVEDDVQTGYGYGLSSIDYFHVFGVPGDNRGYFIQDSLVPIAESSPYTFGIGGEYSELFPQNKDTKRLEILINGSEVPDGAIFDVYVVVRTIGGSTDYLLQDVEEGVPFSIYISKNNTTKMIEFSDPYGSPMTTGFFSIEDTDSFFDILVYIKDIQDEPKTIKTTSSVVAHDDSVLKIKLFGGIAS